VAVESHSLGGAIIIFDETDFKNIRREIKMENKAVWTN
jgi:hypothetical protein